MSLSLLPNISHRNILVDNLMKLTETEELYNIKRKEFELYKNSKVRNNSYGNWCHKNHVWKDFANEQFNKVSSSFNTTEVEELNEKNLNDVDLETALMEVTLNVLRIGEQGQTLLSSRHNWIKVQYLY